jgi:hypothetical protein
VQEVRRLDLETFSSVTRAIGATTLDEYQKILEKIKLSKDVSRK